MIRTPIWGIRIKGCANTWKMMGQNKSKSLLSASHINRASEGTQNLSKSERMQQLKTQTKKTSAKIEWQYNLILTFSLIDARAGNNTSKCPNTDTFHSIHTGKASRYNTHITRSGNTFKRRNVHICAHGELKWQLISRAASIATTARSPRYIFGRNNRPNHVQWLSVSAESTNGKCLCKTIRIQGILPLW